VWECNSFYGTRVVDAHRYFTLSGKLGCFVVISRRFYNKEGGASGTGNCFSFVRNYLPERKFK